MNIPGDAFLIVNTWQCYISNVIPGEVRALPLMVRGISILHVAGTSTCISLKPDTYPGITKQMYIHQQWLC